MKWAASHSRLTAVTLAGTLAGSLPNAHGVVGTAA